MSTKSFATAMLGALTLTPAAVAAGWEFRVGRGEDGVCILTAPGETWSTTNNLSISNSRPVPEALTIEYAEGYATAIFKGASSATMVVANEHNHRVLAGNAVGDDFWVGLPKPAAFAGFLVQSVYAFSTDTGRYGIALDESDHAEVKHWAACVKNFGG
jgi:hypothetical protein